MCETRVEFDREGTVARLAALDKTQHWLALETKIADAQLNKILTGRNPGPRPITVLKIENALLKAERGVCPYCGGSGAKAETETE